MTWLKWAIGLHLKTILIVKGNQMDCNEFLRGQRDCMNGEPHKAGMSESYDRGYAAQYQHEQNLNNITRSKK